MRGEPFVVPAPETRVPVSMYLELRTWMLENDPDAPEMLEWSEDIVPPENPERLAGEIIWIILCAGRSAQAARTIEARVRKALDEGTPVVKAFGYKAKANAIERAWREREKDFAAMHAVMDGGGGAQALVDWCGSIPFVGDDTRQQLGKNLGVDCCKPDIWLCRLTGFPDRPRRRVDLRFKACMALCEPLAAAAGERIASTDSILWLACNKGVLQVGPDAGPVSFVPRKIKARNIIAPPIPTPDPQISLL